MNLKQPLLTLLAAAALLSPASHAAPVQTPHVQAELVAEHTALVPGAATNRVALKLTPEPGWHVYWRNPGDSGIATQIQWTLPAGIAASEMEWPYPHAQRLEGLTNYGYDSETLHLVPLTVQPLPSPATLKAKAKWLVCQDICIPGQADLELTLPVADTAEPDARWTAAFARTRTQLPMAAPNWQTQFQIDGGALHLGVTGADFSAVGKAEFFPVENSLVAHHAPQKVVLEKSGLRLSQKLGDYFTTAPATVEGVLVLRDADGTRAYAIRAEPGTVAPVTASSAPTVADTSLPFVLLLALLGGLLLNLMPCVFPVLSLKALSVLNAPADQHGAHRAHALTYTAGVVLSCLALAGILLGLRAAGEAVGWGFQLQSPVFVALLVYLLFALGLSMSGVFEIGARWMNTGDSLTRRDGLSGTFFTGVLAVVVATPCTAPFMGTALGYATTQPAAVALVVFAALGLGLALPFLLMGFWPRLAHALPKPGAWMQTFRQLMAYPLYLSAVWLLWVLARQVGIDGAALVLAGLVVLALALWLLGRPGVKINRIVALIALAAALYPLTSPLLRPTGTAAPDADQAAWSEETVTKLRAEQRTVFVNFTADWCITCKLNERVALNSETVRRSFKDKNVAWLTADWTNADAAITAALAQHGRNGVPLYLVYPNGGEPTVLPQILTPELVVQSLP